MAPRNKPMPKSKPKVDTATRLLQERELDYQGAMGIAVNDLRTKEAELQQIQKAYADSGIKIKGFDEFLSNKHDEIKRAYRVIISEPGYKLLEDDLRNYAIAFSTADLLDAKKSEEKQRKISQPIPGTQAHHPASVSSVESYIRNMPMAEQRRTLDLITAQGYTVGSLAKGFIPLSGPAHLGGGEKWGRAFAHVGKEGVESDPGRFKGTALPKTTTAEEAFAAMKPMLDEQRMLNEAAYSHPVEQQMRAVAENLLGKPITWMGGAKEELKAQRAAAKAQGINATTISKGFSKYPQLMGTEQVPGVSIMTDVGARVPLGTKASPEVRKQATAMVRSPQVVLTRSQTLGQKAAAIVNREPVKEPKPVIVVPTKPAKPKLVSKPAPKPTVKKVAAKPNRTVLKSTRKAPAVSPTTVRQSPRRQMSASEQIKQLQRSVPDVLKIHPEMSQPSVSLIQGI